MEIQTEELKAIYPPELKIVKLCFMDASWIPSYTLGPNNEVIPNQFL